MSTHTSHVLLAYLDPGTGSILLQLLLAGAAGVVYVLGLYWRGVKAFLPFIFSAPDPSEQDDENTPPTLGP